MQSLIRAVVRSSLRTSPSTCLSSRTAHSTPNSTPAAASTEEEETKTNLSIDKEQIAEKEMEKMKKNPYFDKYSAKLKKLEDTNPDEFQKKVDTLVDDKVDDEVKGREAAEEMRIKMNDASSQTKPKKLESIMKVDLLMGKSEEQIGDIWRQYHQSKNSIFAIIPANEYEMMYKKLKAFPCFIYPVPRGTGYEFYMQQFANNQINFTPLSIYKLKKEESINCLSMIHYTELIPTKGIVLMHGEPDTSLVSIAESQLLALQVKMYYGIQSGLKFNLVRQFNVTPDAFRHMDLVKEFENYKKDINVAKNMEY